MGTHKFGLLGETLQYSLSPQIYEMFGLSNYELYSIPKDNIAAFFLSAKLKGFNITTPYKRLAFDLCDHLSEDAKRVGSVNTVVIEKGQLYGYHTEYYGFLFMTDQMKIDFKDQKVLILGAGESSSAVHMAVLDRGAAKITHLCDHVPLDTNFEVDAFDQIGQYRDYDVLIHTGAVGLGPNAEQAQISLDLFTNLSLVIDLAYHPLRTRLVLDAREKNIPAFNGLLMLVAQSKMAAELYLNKDIPEDEIFRVYHQLLHKIENVVFVGMPGSGKTAIGAEIAQRMNRQFVDIDHYIHMTTGLHPAEWIVSRGESAFRHAESTALAQISAMQGIVIAPGGGGILSFENRLLLKQNSRVYWLKRPMARLDREDKPLTADLEALYEARRALYEAVSDYAILNEDRPSDIADKIIDEFHQKRWC